MLDTAPLRLPKSGLNDLEQPLAAELPSIGEAGRSSGRGRFAGGNQ